MATTVDIVVHPDVALDDEAIRTAALKAAGRRTAEVAWTRVVRRSVDARRGRVRLQLRVQLGEAGDVEAPAPRPVDLPTLGSPRVGIVGAGPAGMFCAWALAQQGIASVVLERGQPVRRRRHDLAALMRRGELDPESNYCYGEGGAGTFSDGKLYTRAHKRGAVEEVVDALIAYGAPPKIAVDARPHVGTNRLPAVVTSMREHLESAGVAVRFGARVTALRVDGGRATGVVLADGETIEVDAVVIAAGHSAHDVHRFTRDAGVVQQFKPFAIGVRIEHPQAFIDELQLGSFAGHPAVGAASYRLVQQTDGGGVFSFCMCPGGFICPAATDPEHQVVNGWSPSSRRGRFANSGFVAEVGPAQLQAFGLDPADPWAGVVLQRRLEAAAYTAGGGGFVGPAQRLDDFAAGRPSTELPPCSYARGTAPARIDELLGPLAPSIRAALTQVGRRMPGFVSPDAIAVGVESRTSAPVRLLRDAATLEAVGCTAVYPCAEGAGYAGGIMSAALDGIRVAAAVARALER